MWKNLPRLSAFVRPSEISFSSREVCSFFIVLFFSKDVPIIYFILTCNLSQHHAFPHPKIYSLPLGVRPSSAQAIAAFLSSTVKNGTYTPPKKKKLILINNSGWWYRAKVNAYFKEKFNETNSYSFLKGLNSTKTPKQKHLDYLNDISRTKYVICPPGMNSIPLTLINLCCTSRDVNSITCRHWI
jgi:hypothetical protein